MQAMWHVQEHLFSKEKKGEWLQILGKNGKYTAKHIVLTIFRCWNAIVTSVIVQNLLTMTSHRELFCSYVVMVTCSRSLSIHCSFSLCYEVFHFFLLNRRVAGWCNKQSSPTLSVCPSVDGSSTFFCHSFLPSFRSWCMWRYVTRERERERGVAPHHAWVNKRGRKRVFEEGRRKRRK